MSSITDDPINWAPRDESLVEVPAEASIQRSTDERWRQINIAVFDATEVGPDIKDAEQAILSRRNMIDSGSLRADLDWRHDLERARASHRFHLANLDQVKRKRTDYIEYWKKWTVDASDYFREISIQGQKTVYLLHGAVALGALHILSQVTRPNAQIVLTAKCAIVFSALGILVAGFGQVTSFHFSSLLVNKIRGNFASEPKWRKVRAFSRYVRRHGWLVVYGERGLYISIFWFGFYIIILLMMLISA